jgi:predicted secreted protein
MATTDIMNSTVGVLMIEGTVIAELTGCSLSITHSPRNVTNKGSAGWKELLEGLREWSMSAQAMYIPNGSFATLFAAYTGRTKLTIRLASTVSADDYYEGEAYLTSGTLDSPSTEDNVVFDVSFDGTGPITEGATA